MAACLNSRTGFTHVGWLYCILHLDSKATAPWMLSTEALNCIVASAVSSPLWLVGSNCWYLCFALSNILLQLFDLVDTLNMTSRKTGLRPRYLSWKSLAMFLFSFYSYGCPWHGRMAVWFCLTKLSLRQCKCMVKVAIFVHFWLFSNLVGIFWGHTFPIFRLFFLFCPFVYLFFLK